MNTIDIFAPLTISNAEGDEKRLVSGFFDPGEPNKDGFLLDFDTSLPYIQAYIQRFQEATDGESFGAVRLMHNPDTAGIGRITWWVPDLQAKNNPIKVRIDDDAVWAKIVARNLTGFSGNWNVIGKMWQDDDLTKKLGKRIMRFTGDPVEVSIVDVPRIRNGSTFTEIENAEGGKMVDEPTTVQNGIWEGNRLAEHFGSLVELLKYVEIEEAAEGEGQQIPQEMRSALLQLKPVVQAYQARQLDEKLPDSPDGEEDVEIGYLEGIIDGAAENADNGEGGVKNGDFPGHPFRGNQFAGGSAGASAQHLASRDAARKSASANNKGSSGAHKAAVRAHSEAAKQARAAGKEKLAKYHEGKVTEHKAASVRFERTEKNCNNGDGITNHEEESMKKEDLDAILNGVAERMKPIEERLTALESVKNGEGAPATPVAPAPKPVLNGEVMSHDEGRITPPASAPSSTPKAITNADVSSVINDIDPMERTPDAIAAALKSAGLI